MTPSDAQKIVAGILAPVPYDRFFGEIFGQRPLALLGEGSAERARIAGDDPRAALLDGFETYAPELTSHIREAKGPAPKARMVEGPDSFRDLIREYHAGGHTVRFPEVLELSPALTRLTRALEVLTENPVGVVVFWSDGGAEAPVHHDEVDVIVIQLVGTKRWYISDLPTALPNRWRGLGETEPALGPHSTYDVAPGDLLYVPRGTPHTVRSTSESVHLAIGFVPVTAREAVAAALDHLSDLDRSIRENLGTRIDHLALGTGLDAAMADIRASVEKLHQHCQSDDFLKDALAFRRARMVLDLPKLARGGMGTPLSANSRVRHTDLAMAHVTATEPFLDFRQPGEQILIHHAMADSMRYIAATEEFRVGDIPGAFGDDIRIALTGRLLTSGFLELVG